VDPCLVGVWRSTRYQITNKIENVDTTFTGPGGDTKTITADGRVTHDYNTMAPRTATVNGVHWSNVTRGTITGRIHTSGSTIYWSDLEAHGTWQILRNGRLASSGELSASLEPVHYTCSGNTFVEQASFYIIEMTRVSATP
jgi:hypothetical protein